MTSWLSRRLLPLHLGALVALAVCVLMGLWQLGVYDAKHDDAARAARSAPAVDILKVWGPDDPFTSELLNRRVRIAGQVLDVFTVKRPDGQNWVAATVRVSGTRSSIIVVLGHQRDVLDMYPAPRFTAFLQPPEEDGDLSIARRVNETKGDLFSGYALLESPRTALRPVSPPDPEVSWTEGLRNLVYALQWWLFGGFAVFMWWRMAADIRDGATDTLAPWTDS